MTWLQDAQFYFQDGRFDFQDALSQDSGNKDMITRLFKDSTLKEVLV